MDRTFRDSDFHSESPEAAQRHRAQLAKDAEARAATQRDREARDSAEAAAERRTALESMLESKFLQAGGTADEFAKVKGDLVTDHLRAAALRGDDAARAANSDRYRN